MLPIALLSGLLAASSLLADEKPAPQPISAAKKLEIIAQGEKEIPRGQRVRQFAKEGAFDVVGRLIVVGKKVYFQTTDQSYIPEEQRFPYPELMFELFVSETHAYQPLFAGKYLQNRQVLYDGPIRIQGNWAYEGAFHIFALAWVDQVSKAEDYPAADWETWLRRRQTAKSSAGNSRQ